MEVADTQGRISTADPHSTGDPDPSPTPLRILLWCQQGSSDKHYTGPGSSAVRLYRTLHAAFPGRAVVHLAHALDDQPETVDAYASQTLIAPEGRFHQARLMWKGKRWIDRNAGRFDVFLGEDGWTSTVVAAVAAEKRGVPACVKLATHNMDLADKDSLRHKLLGLARRRRQAIIDHVSGVICTSRAIVEECRGYGIPDEKIAYLPYGVNVDRFRPPHDEEERREARRSAGIPEEAELVIAFCGLVVERKRPHLLTQALTQLPDSVHVLLIGPTPDAAYAARVKEVAGPAASRVHWTGFQEDPSPFYRAANLYSLPSSSEGMANSILEAMASGLVPLLTRISGSTDVVTQGTVGRLIEPTTDAVVEAVRIYLDDPSRVAAESVEARKLIERRYSDRYIVQQHLELFERIRRGEPATGLTLQPATSTP